MLPEIGWVIGAYIKITRMMEILKPKEGRNMIGSVVVGVFAFITIAISSFVTYDLFVRGTKLSGL